MRLYSHLLCPKLVSRQLVYIQVSWQESWGHLIPVWECITGLALVKFQQTVGSMAILLLLLSIFCHFTPLFIFVPLITICVLTNSQLESQLCTNRNLSFLPIADLSVLLIRTLSGTSSTVSVEGYCE